MTEVRWERDQDSPGASRPRAVLPSSHRVRALKWGADIAANIPAPPWVAVRGPYPYPSGSLVSIVLGIKAYVEEKSLAI